MIRRSFLKLIAASPLLGLFKKKKPEGLTLEKLMKCKAELDKGGVQPDEDRMILLTPGTFQPGDRVWIGTLPNSMRHFQSNKQATVLYSYRSKYGNANGRDDTIDGVDYVDDYALKVDGHGFSAWYPGVCLSKLSETSGTSSVGYRVTWKDNKMHAERVSPEEFYKASIFNDYNLI